MTDRPRDGELKLIGRVMPASNATFIGELGEDRIVYKPVAGERPLWDFPDGTLADREYAARLVSVATGWDVVPTTWLAQGPHGLGMFQTWCEVDPEHVAVDVVAAGSTPEGWLHVLDGLNGDDEPVEVVHEDTVALRRMVIFDVVTNNADRKGGHVLAMSDGHRYGVDHGLTFHVEPKLRTILWGWAGQSLLPDEVAVLEDLAEQLAADLGEQLRVHLMPSEVAATLSRVERLLEVGTLPEPAEGWPAIPWPPL